FAGFFSKDSILLGAWMSPNSGRIFWAVAIFTAFMTAYYTFRIFYRIFITPPADPHTVDHAHESPKVMLIPLGILAVLSLIGGWVGIPGHGLFCHFLEPVFPKTREETQPVTEYALMGTSLVVAVAGILLARYLHVKQTATAARLA